MEASREILSWYVEAGIDVFLEDEPINRFEESTRMAQAQAAVKPKPKPALKSRQEPSTPVQPRESFAPPTMPQAARQNATIPDGKAVERAQEMAASAKSLQELKTVIEQFEGCNLKRTAKHSVFAEGDPNAPLMLIGSGPNRDEDMAGLPFVGRSGQLLEKMLGAIGLERNDVYLSSALPWRPPGNRPPTPQEMAICRPFIERHLELAKPKMVLIMGNVAAKVLFNSQKGVMQLRGGWSEFKTASKAVETLVTFDPDYLLNQPAHKKYAWQDLLNLNAKLKSLTP